MNVLNLLGLCDNEHALRRSVGRMHRPLWTLVLSTLLVVLAGCGGGGEKQSQSGTFVMALPAIPSSLDPADFQSDTSNNSFFVWASLLTQYPKISADAKQLQGPEQLVGDLAKSWERTSEGYLVTLRQVTSPFKHALTADDVKWSFERAMAIDPIAQYQLSLGSVAEKAPIEVVDDTHFLLRVSEFGSPTLAILDWYGESILDATEVRSHATSADPWAKEWLKTHTAGFGPYHVVDFRPGVRIKLASNPGYWTELPFKTVVMQAVPDASNRVQLVASGKADFAQGISYAQARTLSGTSSHANVIAAREANTDQITLNLKFAPFKSPDVRRALSLALNRADLVSGAYHGYGEPAGMINSAIPSPLPARQPLTHDVAQAKALLTRAGYPHGFTFTLSVNNQRPGEYSSDLAVLLASQLKDIGVTVHVQVVPSLADYAAGWKGKFQAWLDKNAAPVVDVGAWAMNQIATKGVNNKGGYSNPQADEVIASLLKTAEPADRDEAIVKLSNLLDSDMPYIPLVETVRIVPLSQRITGYSTDPIRQLYPSRLEAK